ncbi:hypothetical protein [Vagococcus silagei]|uniref:Uncharacterized protein n=1 Tax=Vagococcus silagei TaxID=2508885 RepID=A0A4S3B8I8_9ENTE|nr:hypothetical protein [Vagococcus silagei]THB62156.1 hypothetical protein ESZ54_01440 [Vagococcus silagei]
MHFLYLVLITLGVVLVGVAITLGIRVFRTPIIFDSSKDNYFRIETDGVYDIWARGKVLRVNNLGEVIPQIRHAVSDEVVPLHKVLFQTTSQGFSKGSIKLFHFIAITGKYLFEEVTGSSLNALEDTFYRNSRFSGQNNPVVFLIKPHQSIFVIIGFILCCVFGVNLIVFGSMAWMLF